MHTDKDRLKDHKILTNDITAANSKIFTKRSSNCSKISSHSGLPDDKRQSHYQTQDRHMSSALFFSTIYATSAMANLPRVLFDKKIQLKSTYLLLPATLKKNKTTEIIN